MLCMYGKMHKSLYQARSRVQDSSQKLDLLRLSLEHRLGESSQEALREPVTKQGLPTVYPPPEGQPQNCLLCSFPSSTSSSFLKPASLTGNYYLQTLQVCYVCLWIWCKSRMIMFILRPVLLMHVIFYRHTWGHASGMWGLAEITARTRPNNQWIFFSGEPTRFQCQQPTWSHRKPLL